MDLFDSDDAATQLDENEKSGLIPSWIATRAELNEAEFRGVLYAQGKVLGRKQKEVLSEQYFRNLHKTIFGKVWKWAGEYRLADRNIGIPYYQIPVEIRKLLDDCKYWIENSTYSWIEIGARFHHRLVWIHPFPNGNGRTARLMTDVILKENKQPLFTWGGGNLVEVSSLRKKYIAALREADHGNVLPLVEFVNS